MEHPGQAQKMEEEMSVTYWLPKHTPGLLPCELQRRERIRAKSEDRHLDLVGREQWPDASVPIGNGILEAGRLESVSYTDCEFRQLLVGKGERPPERTCVSIPHNIFWG